MCTRIQGAARRVRAHLRHTKCPRAYQPHKVSAYALNIMPNKFAGARVQKVCVQCCLQARQVQKGERAYRRTERAKCTLAQQAHDACLLYSKRAMLECCTLRSHRVRSHPKRRESLIYSNRIEYTRAHRPHRVCLSMVPMHCWLLTMLPRIASKDP